MNFETPEADAVEQHQHYGETEEDPVGDLLPTDSAGDVNPADLAEQQLVVPDDEEYEHG